MLRYLKEQLRSAKPLDSEAYREALRMTVQSDETSKPLSRRSTTLLPLLSAHRVDTLAALRDATWIVGCERCRSHLLSLLRRRGVRAADQLFGC